MTMNVHLNRLQAHPRLGPEQRCSPCKSCRADLSFASNLGIRPHRPRAAHGHGSLCRCAAASGLARPMLFGAARAALHVYKNRAPLHPLHTASSSPTPSHAFCYAGLAAHPRPGLPLPSWPRILVDDVTLGLPRLPLIAS